MWQERPFIPFPNEPWGFDNCAFLHWRRGERFNDDAYRSRLDIAYKVGLPYIAIVPDEVAGGKASLERSWSWMAGRDLPNDWPWYLAVQDGMSRRDVEGIIRGGFRGLFLGGTNKFKQATAWIWAELAHEFGLLFHYGRAGTLRKLDHAKLIEADSLDSAYPLWTKRRLKRFADHSTSISSQIMLEMVFA